MGSDPDQLVELCRVGSEGEAGVVVAVLTSAGIHATGSNPGADVFGGAMDAIIRRPVRVRRADLERARAVLDESRELAADVDWDLVEDAGDPADDLEPVDRSKLKRLVVRSIIFVAILLLLATAIIKATAPTGGSGVSPLP